MLKSVFTVVLPSSQGARGDRHVLRPGDGAGEVVGQVHRGLDRLRELDHHHITQCVAVLVVKSVKISARTHKKQRTFMKMNSLVIVKKKLSRANESKT